jgi:putative hydrolase of the HAD superfamily
MTIEVIGLDADDTLWHSEDGFEETIAHFVALLGPYATGLTEDDLRVELDRTERRNVHLFGYGVKSYTLSMVEAAIAIGGATLPASVITRVVDLGRELLSRPVELIDGAIDVVHELSHGYQLLLITKGDLLHQERKINESGLAEYFDAIEVVSEKDPASYARLLREHRVEPAQFLMVGNSVRSDVLPVLALGARAVHVPYHLVWAHEIAEHDGSVPELASLAELPAWLADNP